MLGGATYVDAVIVELVLTGVEPPTVSVEHVLQADGAVVVSVVFHPLSFPVGPHVVAHPLVDGLDAHPTELTIVVLSEHVDVSLHIRGGQVRVASLQLGKQLLVSFVPWS